MFLLFFDASALVKHYVIEPGSGWVRGLIDTFDPDTGRFDYIVLVAGVTIAEVSAALAILHRQGKLTRRQRAREYSRFLSHINDRFGLLPVVVADCFAAAELAQRHPLKAYDAMQLAVAARFAKVLSEQHETLSFVSGDRTLLQAAQAEGLTIDNPFDHVSPDDQPQAGGDG